MSACPLLAPDGGDRDLEPHPELVRIQKPTASQLAEAISVLGGLPGGSYLSGQIRISLPALSGETP